MLRIARVFAMVFVPSLLLMAAGAWGAYVFFAKPKEALNLNAAPIRFSEKAFAAAAKGESFELTEEEIANALKLKLSESGKLGDFTIEGATAKIGKEGVYATINVEKGNWRASFEAEGSIRFDDREAYIQFDKLRFAKIPFRAGANALAVKLGTLPEGADAKKVEYRPDEAGVLFEFPKKTKDSEEGFLRNGQK